MIVNRIFILVCIIFSFFCDVCSAKLLPVPRFYTLQDELNFNIEMARVQCKLAGYEFTSKRYYADKSVFSRDAKGSVSMVFIPLQNNKLGCCYLEYKILNTDETYTYVDLADCSLTVKEDFLVGSN